MFLPTLLIASLIAALFLTIVITDFRNRKKGKHSCSCGGSCDSCGGMCHIQKQENIQKK